MTSEIIVSILLFLNVAFLGICIDRLIINQKIGKILKKTRLLLDQFKKESLTNEELEEQMKVHLYVRGVFDTLDNII